MSSILDYVKQALNDDSGSYFSDAEYTNYILKHVNTTLENHTLKRVGAYHATAGAWYIMDSCGCCGGKAVYGLSAPSGTSGTVVEHIGAFSGTYNAASSTMVASGNCVDIPFVIHDVLMDISTDYAKVMLYQEMNGLATNLSDTASAIRKEAGNRLGVRGQQGYSTVLR